MRIDIFILCGLFFLMQASIRASADSSIDLKNTRLYQSCSKAVTNKRFEGSYCGYAITSIFHGYGLTLYHTPPGNRMLCAQAALKDVLGRVNFSPDITPQKVAQNFLDWVEKNQKPLEGLNDLADLSERALISSIVVTYSAKNLTLDEMQSGKKMNEDTKKKWTRGYIKVKDLYLSCSATDFNLEKIGFTSFDAHKYRDLCHGTIRGLAMGHVLALYNLPIYDKKDKCFEKKTEIVDAFKKRMCLKDAGTETTQIATNFVTSVKAMPPERIMGLGSDRSPEWVIAPYVIEGCSRNR